MIGILVIKLTLTLAVFVVYHGDRSGCPNEPDVQGSDVNPNKLTDRLRGIFQNEVARCFETPAHHLCHIK